MTEKELLQNILVTANSVSYVNRGEFDVIKKRAEMVMMKIFGADSHYIYDLKNISYSPSFIFVGEDNDWQTPFENGLKEFKNLIKIAIEDVNLSSNYNDSSTHQFIKSEGIPKPASVTYKEIKVLIASPADVLKERELLLDKLETKFRREHFEERCGSRIIVEGWEFVASQSGYSQDIINTDLVFKSNIVLALFRHKLGSPTIDLKAGKDRSPSGTAEEILYAIRNKQLSNPPLGMAYFYATAPVLSLDSVEFEKTKTDWERLKEFREEIKNEILYKTYKSEDEILEIACRDLCDNIIKYFK